MQLWNISSRQLITSLQNVLPSNLPVAFNRDGRIIAYVESIENLRTVRLWDVDGSKGIGTPLTQVSRATCCVAFSTTDKNLLAIGDESVTLWDIATRKNLGELEVSYPKGHYAQVNTLSFSADGSILAAGLSDGTVLVWNVKTRQQLHEIKAADEGVEVSKLAFSPAGKILATATGTPPSHVDSSYHTRLWDLTTWSPIGPPLPGTRGRSVTFSPDGKFLATADSYSLRLWNVSELLQSSG